MLVALERANLFVVPLDDRREWYRYHHLFADVLRARLLSAVPERAAVLHSRASEWYERHGSARGCGAGTRSRHPTSPVPPV